MNIEMSQHDFVMWKKDPVTLAVFKYLTSIADHYREMMTSRDIISSSDGHLRLNEMRGYLSAIEDLVNMQSITLEEDENEESESPRVSSFSQD